MAAESDWQRYTPWGAPTSTMASAAALAPGPGLTELTGNVAITSIVPPVTGPHILCLIFAGTAGITAGNNIGNTKATVAGEALLLVYNTLTNKYHAVG